MSSFARPSEGCVLFCGCWRATRSRNSRPELIADDEQGAQFLPSRPWTGVRGPINGRRHLAPRLRWFWFSDHIGPIDSVMPEKRKGCGPSARPVVRTAAEQTVWVALGPCGGRQVFGQPAGKMVRLADRGFER